MNSRIHPSYRQRVLSNLEHHKPTDEQLERITKVRHAAKAFVSVLMDNCVFGADLERALAGAREANMFGVASIVLEDPVIAPEEVERKFEYNQRIFHRRADLFGRVVGIRNDCCLIRYEPPYDQNVSEATPVPFTELMHAHEALHLMEAASAGILRG